MTRILSFNLVIWFLFLLLAGCDRGNFSSSSTKLLDLSSCTYSDISSTDAAVILTVDSSYRTLLTRYESVYEPLYKNSSCFKKTPADSTLVGSFQSVDNMSSLKGLVHCYSKDIDPESTIYLYKYSDAATAASANEQWAQTRIKEISVSSTEEGGYSVLVDYNQITVGNWIIGGVFLGHVQQNQFIPSGYSKLSREFFAAVSSNNVLRIRCESSAR